MLFSSNWHQMVVLLCRLWILITIARAAKFAQTADGFHVKNDNHPEIGRTTAVFVKFAPNGCFIVPLANLINMTRTANLLNPLVVFTLKNMTTPASKNTTVEFIKSAQNFCFIVPLVDFDQNCKYL